jgi:hypothetical protein
MRQSAKQDILSQILGFHRVASLAFEILHQRWPHLGHEAGIVQGIVQ